jgi:hypothetical protein
MGERADSYPLGVGRPTGERRSRAGRELQPVVGSRWLRPVI